ncbi:threonine-phosphate decarboxylase CobD [Secundilactobacillus similis]|uniref:threonine-phosphate decarboxylase n=1 Tax=Secundilactobacillus similis DSM 23365 = JCM 2765 TaxID=1423804 RepID=A0A0R2EGN0_9LACO|nr:threonine-phosphate decarboxylase CobD [Secundilactobacillus similis]KRN15583.1 threonine-phosphate decarboxylase [Secundilactobacillus similis DSM 23365 = JCM 2765]
MIKVIHGGNREAIAQRTGLNAATLIDFSANINPLGLSPKLKTVLTESLDELVYYPNPQYPQLKAAISHYLNVSADDVFVGNGAVQMIFDTATALQSTHAVVLAPTFGEYERSLRRAGATVDHYRLRAENQFQIQLPELIQFLDQQPTVDLLCLCNPNNPSGQVLLPDEVQRLADYCRQHQIWLILDEAFMDFIDHDRLSYINRLSETDPVMIIRSATKFFAIPGLRLGFAVTKHPQLKQQLLEQAEPWSVNTLAARFGEHMYDDQAYIQATYAWLLAEKKALYEGLQTVSYLTVYPSSANYYLFKSGIPQLRERLWPKGLMIRDCSDYVGLDASYYRVAVRSHDDNQTLLAALHDLA